jgi:HPt (histidine-containing phosphotransfer) domain-containing protein
VETVMNLRDDAGRDGGDPDDELADIIAQMSEEFLRDAHLRTVALAELAAGLDAADDPEALIDHVIREAHTLKGSAGTLGMGGISRAAGAVEHLGRLATSAGWPPGMNEALSHLQDEARVFKTPRAA